MNFSAFVAMIVLSILVYFYFKRTSTNRATPSKRWAPPDAGSGGNAIRPPTFDLSIVAPKWTEIQAMKKNGPSGLRNALMEADKLLDYTMQAKGFSGTTMGERLKSGGSAFSNLNDIWNAHKLRNVMAHEVAHDMVPSQIEHAIDDLGRGLRDLGVQL